MIEYLRIYEKGIFGVFRCCENLFYDEMKEEKKEELTLLNDEDCNDIEYKWEICKELNRNLNLSFEYIENEIYKYININEIVTEEKEKLMADFLKLKEHRREAEKNFDNMIEIRKKTIMEKILAWCHMTDNEMIKFENSNQFINEYFNFNQEDRKKYQKIGEDYSARTKSMKEVVNMKDSYEIDEKLCLTDSSVCYGVPISHEKNIYKFLSKQKHDDTDIFYEYKSYFHEREEYRKILKSVLKLLKSGTIGNAAMVMELNKTIIARDFNELYDILECEKDIYSKEIYHELVTYVDKEGIELRGLKLLRMMLKDIYG